MKLPDIYHDWRVMAGLALIMLGAGNWAVGLKKTEESMLIIAGASDVGPSSDFRSFDELDASGGGAVLRPLMEKEVRVSYATARMDFYHVMYLMGQGMAAAGVGLMLFGFMAIIQRDARRALRRFSQTGTGPPSR